MKILITGASGMLGSDFSDILADENLLGVDRQHRPHVQIPFEPCDLANASDLDSVFDTFNPEVVIHTAAMTQVDLCETDRDAAMRNNVGAVQELVRKCNTNGSLLIFFSTDYVFQGNGSRPYLETDPQDPLNFYGKTKYLAEKHILSHASNFIIFRISWLFGRYGRSFPQSILEMTKKMTELKVVNDQKGCPTYSRDVAASISKWLREKYHPGVTKHKTIYHLVNQGVTTWYDYAKLILDLMQKKNHRVIPISSQELDRVAKRPAYSVLSTEKVSRELGIVLRHWQEAVREYLSAYHAEELQ